MFQSMCSRVHRLQELWHEGSGFAASGSRAQVLLSTGSVVVVHRLSCSETFGIFLDQGLNLCPALAGRFFSSEPSGKPSTLILSTLLFHIVTQKVVQCSRNHRGLVAKDLLPVVAQSPLSTVGSGAASPASVPLRTVMVNTQILCSLPLPLKTLPLSHWLQNLTESHYQ